MNYTDDKYRLALRGLFFYLLCGGIVNLVGIVVDFFFKLEYGNSVYVAKNVWFYISIGEWVVFLIVFGLKYVENIGYIDDYDHIHSIGYYFKRMSLTMLLLLIPIALSTGGGGAVFSYVISLCYEPSFLLAHLINNQSYYNSWSRMGSIMHYWPQFAGVFIVLFLNIFLLLPFYLLGRHNRKTDLKNGIKLRIKS